MPSTDYDRVMSCPDPAERDAPSGDTFIEFTIDLFVRLDNGRAAVLAIDGSPTPQVVLDWFTERFQSGLVPDATDALADDRCRAEAQS